MTPELRKIPHVLDDDELPFVIGFTSDSRASLEANGVEYRRGIDRVSVSWTVDPLYLRAIVLNSEGSTYLIATSGPILNDWWPVLQREGGNPARPLLSAAVAKRPQVFTSDDVSIGVSIVPSGPELEATTAIVGIRQADRLTDEDVLLARAMSPAVIKAALLVLEEYRTLVDPVPEIDVNAGGITVPLSVMLDSARAAAGAIAWAHSVG